MFVVFLDYSAAFDTVDHNIALDVLQNKFCITSYALSWFQLPARSCVSGVVYSQDSSPVDVDDSLPQGSTPGTLLFIVRQQSCRRWHAPAGSRTRDLDHESDVHHALHYRATQLNAETIFQTSDVANPPCYSMSHSKVDLDYCLTTPIVLPEKNCSWLPLRG